MTGNLKDRWDELWRNLDVVALLQIDFEKLIQAYSSADRFYHNLTHVEDCLSLFDQTKSLAAHPEEVELAIWFHDVVYDTREEANEQKSAAWARAVIGRAGLGGSLAERVSRSILATCHCIEVEDTDAQLMVDVDLSILGADPAIFWRYEENIRKEYVWVPESLFRRRRKEVLRGFLNRPHIYCHRQYRAAFEEKARLHLEQAIARLAE